MTSNLRRLLSSVTGRRMSTSTPAASRVASTAPTNNVSQWAAIAFGSNVGDRVKNIESALQATRDKDISVMHVSQLYETEPMYYLDQDTFLNGVALVRTDKAPLDLLDTLQSIELTHNRTWDASKPKGPRTLDLDILMCGNTCMNHERLILPHAGMNERAFVLRPLQDVLSSAPEAVAADFCSQAKGLWRPIDSLTQVTVLTPKLHLRRVHDESSTRNVTDTQIMAIINVTPDSFSDGGKHDVNTVVKAAREHIEAGAAILDIGGQSTRPGATYLSAEEELSRVLPVLRELKKIPEIASKSVAISLDTFHAKVVDECAGEGLIDLVNDITGGTHDPDMFRVTARHSLSIVLMHMRGTVETMHKDLDEDTDIVTQIIHGLRKQATLAEQAGIPRWRIILDPGVGFSKTETQNLDILARLDEQMHCMKEYAWLVGASRKGFLGRIAGVKTAKERDWATAAVTAECVKAGVDITRVHATKEMSEVAKISKAIWWRDWHREESRKQTPRDCKEFWARYIEMKSS